jgi:hypothetical protein
MLENTQSLPVSTARRAHGFNWRLAGDMSGIGLAG